MRGKTNAFKYTEDQRLFSFFKEVPQTVTSDDVSSISSKYSSLINKMTQGRAYGTTRYFRKGKIRFNVKYSRCMYYPDCLVKILESLVDALLIPLNKKMGQSVSDVFVERAFSYYHIYEKNNINEIRKLKELIC